MYYNRYHLSPIEALLRNKKAVHAEVDQALMDVLKQMTPVSTPKATQRTPLRVEVGNDIKKNMFAYIVKKKPTQTT